MNCGAGDASNQDEPPLEKQFILCGIRIKYLFVGGSPPKRGYMKKFLSVLAASFLLTAFALADTPHASVTFVKKKGHSATKHHAHKAPKHKAPKHTA